MAVKAMSKSSSLLTLKENELQTYGLCRVHQSLRSSFGFSNKRIIKYRDGLNLGNRLMQKFYSFGVHRAGEQAHTCDVAAWPIDAGYEARFDRIAAV
ncbi:MAG: hypothetical protein WBE90_30155 [Xanthobacteraceae bacterium]